MPPAINLRLIGLIVVCCIGLAYCSIPAQGAETAITPPREMMRADEFDPHFVGNLIQVLKLLCAGGIGSGLVYALNRRRPSTDTEIAVAKANQQASPTAKEFAELKAKIEAHEVAIADLRKSKSALFAHVRELNESLTALSSGVAAAEATITTMKDNLADTLRTMATQIQGLVEHSLRAGGKTAR